MAAYSASLLGKCWNNRASETPAASAKARVVVPENPFSENTRRAALRIDSRRSSPLSRRLRPMDSLAAELSVYSQTTEVKRVTGPGRADSTGRDPRHGNVGQAFSLTGLPVGQAFSLTDPGRQARQPDLRALLSRPGWR